MHALIEAAGRHSERPAWACLSDARRSHVGRVADLMGDWADMLALSESDRIRWRAAGLLHDVLKDAEPDDLKNLVAEDWPLPLIHAPAAAERLWREGIEDEELLLAVRYHSVGHPEFEALAEHLYLADYLESGRPFQSDERAVLRARMPDGRTDVLREVARRRITGRLEADDPVLPVSVEFWNRIISS
ncbi:MAG: HD domain-containing protein [Gemmatimonadota bacterium]